MFIKMHRSWTLIALLVFLVSTIGCGSGSREVKMVDSDNGGQVELKKGELLTVTLESNPSTGYAWEVSQTDEAILMQKGKVEFLQVTQPEGLVGAGGTETFRFEAVGVGQVSLTLIYHRSWEENVEPIQTYTLEVVVK